MPNRYNNTILKHNQNKVKLELEMRRCRMPFTWLVAALRRLCAPRSYWIMQNNFDLRIGIGISISSCNCSGTPRSIPTPGLAYYVPLSMAIPKNSNRIVYLARNARKMLPALFTYALCKRASKAETDKGFWERWDVYPITVRGRAGELAIATITAAVTAMSDLLGQLSALSATRSLTHW